MRYVGKLCLNHYLCESHASIRITIILVTLGCLFEEFCNINFDPIILLELISNFSWRLMMNTTTALYLTISQELQNHFQPLFYVLFWQIETYSHMGYLRYPSMQTDPRNVITWNISYFPLHQELLQIKYLWFQGGHIVYETGCTWISFSRDIKVSFTF
jgi:hypothetical protein